MTLCTVCTIPRTGSVRPPSFAGWEGGQRSHKSSCWMQLEPKRNKDYSSLGQCEFILMPVSAAVAALSRTKNTSISEPREVQNEGDLPPQVPRQPSYRIAVFSGPRILAVSMRKLKMANILGPQELMKISTQGNSQTPPNLEGGPRMVTWGPPRGVEK